MMYPGFLNRHIFCSMQPTIPMCNTLPSTKPTLAKTGFPHINAHHTNIVGWEKGSKRDIPERKTTLPKGKNTHSQNCLLQWKVNWRVLAQKKKLGQIYEPLVNMMRPTFMVSFLADSCFRFPVTSGWMRSTCLHISQFRFYCKRYYHIQVILCFFVFVSRSPKPARFECLLQNSTCYYLDRCTVSNLGLRDVIFKNIKSLVNAIMFNAANP